jgi:hypothetical protein
MTRLVGPVAALGVLYGTAQAVDFSLCGGMICVPVTLADGKTHQMLFDTGNFSSWVRLEVAQGLKRPLEPYLRGDKPVPDVYRIGTQRAGLGGKPVSGKFLAIKIGDDVPRDVDGALSYTLFEDQVVEVHYPRHVLSVNACPRGRCSACRDQTYHFRQERPTHRDHRWTRDRRSRAYGTVR